MLSYLRVGILAAGGATLVFSQAPLIGPKSVLNAASYASPGLPNGSVALGSIFSIFGTGLGPAPPSPPLAFPLSATLGGVSIKVFQGATSVNAFPIYISPGQINAIMPSNAPLGRGSVQVTFNGVPGNPAPVTVVNSSFGIYSINSAGIGPGVLFNYVSQSNQPVNAPGTAAMPGQVMTLWGTGLGPVTFPDNVAPTAGNVATQTEVFVGGQPAAVAYSGRSPCCAGDDQVVFTVPQNAPLGCWVPVLIRTGGTNMSNSTTMAISVDGSPCSEPSNPLGAYVISGGNIGNLQLIRTVKHDDFVMTAPTDFTTDVMIPSFRQEPGGQFAFNAKLSLPPAGACTVYTMAGNQFSGASLPGVAAGTNYLDPGAITVTGTKGSRMNAKAAYPFIPVSIGANIPGASMANTTFLDPGNFNVTSAGTSAVGAIQASVAQATPITWTNETQISTIDRTQPLNLTWSGAPTGSPVQIYGGAFDVPNNASASFLCIAPAGSQGFTVPPYILASIPASRANPAQTHAVLSVGALNPPVAFTAKGLNSALLSTRTVFSKTITFK
jgi:uncharacterized protein (TIGR03437 family)